MKNVIPHQKFPIIESIKKKKMTNLFSVFQEIRKVISTEPGFKVDYLEMIDEATFEKANSATVNKRVIVAGWVNQLRLIDNMPMGLSK